MIEGLKVTIQGHELVELCQKRADYHHERAAAYESEIASLKANRIEGMQYTNGDPINSMTEQKKMHEHEAGEMNFIAQHVNMQEDYLLGREDLFKLGIASSRY